MSVARFAFDIEPLHPVFAARLHGLDLGAGLPEDAFEAIVRSFEEYSVLVFPGQRLDSAQQVRFSRRFGPLENAISREAESGPGLHVSYLSNVDAGYDDEPGTRSSRAIDE